ncbi:unnamed protein product [Ceutorhynchus assimilis]|uniref:Uncharacterized protein n=1 Tax=Ceutorhynchus assimilis TaxID=467358 RepID=A0A9N9QD33_9CUCU|nr:unnamed protein product [Ceutorhynchus assimilis]
MVASNKCFKCFNECVFKEDKEKKDLFGFPCDMCCRTICADCNKMMAQEIRVIPSTSRSLIHLCPDCIIELKQLPSMLKKIPALEQAVVDLESKVKNLEQQNQQPDLDKEINEIKEKMSNYEKNQQKSEKSCNQNLNLNNQSQIIDNESLCKTIKNELKSQSELLASQLQTVVSNIRDANKDLVRFLTEKSPDENWKRNTFVNNQINLDTVRNATANATEKIMAHNSNHKSSKNLAKQKLDSRGECASSSKQGIKGAKKNSSGLTAATKQSWFYVGNLGAGTSMEQLKEHLTSHNIHVLTIDKLPTKNQHVASFKISVDPKYEPDQLDAEIWPEDTTRQTNKKTLIMTRRLVPMMAPAM